MYKVTFAPDIGCNVSDDGLLEHVKTNTRRHLPQAKIYQPNNNVVALVCGGPSLISTEKELVEAAWGGAKVVTVNAAYQWCIDRNIKPTATVMLDGREFNSRFVETPVPGCRYLLASQCHPKTFDVCAGRDVTIWHAVASQAEFDYLKEYYFNRFTPVTLGTTVAIRAISLLRILGYQSFDIFGFDNCWLDGQHHAYEQAENDEKPLPVWLRVPGRDDLTQGPFIVSPWQAKQCYDFQSLVRERGNNFRLNVRGPGLIAAVLKMAAVFGENEMTISK